MSEATTVAVLGAGIMANTVAKTLHAQGFELRRYNRTTAAIDGPAIVCASPAQAAEGAAAVWSFVHDDKASRSVWFGEEGALGTAAHAIVIESSTLTPTYAGLWMRKAAEATARPVLAPVTGSRPGAENGTLVAFTAGATADRAAADPLLRVVAQEVIHVGPAPAAATVKLLNNALASVIITGLAETLDAATVLGLDLKQLVEVWSRYGWAAPVASAYGAAMVRGAHPLTDCSVAVIAKDLHYLRTALGESVPPLISAASDRFQHAMARGAGDQEMSAISEAVEPPS
ncbi:NAD(P)-dependent oxidoreductase [Nocardia abscessus]|uniref:NAD(P)-dependent oxidoreductase n=1 Tax=Nocardia abscessus TaxID=120957 RepID=UPI0002EF68AC|nr:NAD(P)-binding domain-containing protein [Nocardia abscessus]MCC3328282.1 NAD(P)-binding domain-containing protein [Nocardia abscessus]